ncbi:hypothetical protein OXX79_013210, partial [Metschnikowia pulcherrima]
MSQIASLSSTTTGAATATSVKKQGNVSTLSRDLTAIDTYGNEFQAPDYTIKDILSVIPAHCYERRTLESLYYVARDIFWMGVFAYAANNYI